MTATTAERARPIGGDSRPPALRLSLVVAAITLLGFALRVWRLGDVPFGFHVDEGHHALAGVSVADRGVARR